jgi:hypothetical protein
MTSIAKRSYKHAARQKTSFGVQNDVSNDSSGFRQTGLQNRVYAARAATPSVITNGFGFESWL